MKNFLRKYWPAIFVFLYVISPDLIPGPPDDMVLIIAEILRRVFLAVFRKNANGKQGADSQR